jgi:Flp pilus assembly protein TadD
MKRKQLTRLSVAAISVILLVPACTLIKDIEYKVAQNPLEMHGDTVTLTINGKFQEKGLHKKAVAEVTPVLITSNGTEKPFKTETFQGTKAAGNGKVIGKEGGSFSYTSRIPYTSDMEVAEVKVKVLPKKGTKEKKLIITDKIADATIITPLLVQPDDKPIMAKDQFVRVTSHTAGMVINYAKDRSEVRPGELKDADYKNFIKWVTEALKNDRIAFKNISIPAWASPEGEIDRNNNLANDRAKSAMNALKAEFKKLKYDNGNNDSFYNLEGKGEDWEGFKTETEKSDLKDKELILRVLQMYSGEQREKEIRNMAKTFQELEKKIFPLLRRSVITLNYDLTGKTDAEMLELSKTKVDSLTAEELFFTANTLVTDLNEKLRLYREASRLFPKDWRGPNNSGYILILQGKINEAKAEFEKAAAIENNATVKNNLGVCARLMGDRDKAAKLYAEAGSAPETQYNMGIINIQRGKYGEAVSQLNNAKNIEPKKGTFNLALAQLLNGNANEAKTTIESAADGETAVAHYLRAIIGARTNDKSYMINSLKTAIQKDSKFKEKAGKDREFLKYATDADFTAIVK